MTAATLPDALHLLADALRDLAAALARLTPPGGTGAVEADVAQLDRLGNVTHVDAKSARGAPETIEPGDGHRDRYGKSLGGPASKKLSGGCCEPDAPLGGFASIRAALPAAISGGQVVTIEQAAPRPGRVTVVDDLEGLEFTPDPSSVVDLASVTFAVVSAVAARLRDGDIRPARRLGGMFVLLDGAQPVGFADVPFDPSRHASALVCLPDGSPLVVVSADALV